MQEKPMAGLHPDIDPDGLLEYSVVYTDRALNHMSRSFQKVMKDISELLKQVFNAGSVAVVPGSGTFGMEAVARQFATDRKCLVIRNGWFSYRWTQIFEAGSIPSETIVMKAAPLGKAAASPFAPAPLDKVIATIKREKPALVFATHVETAAGMMLPNSYLKAVADAVHEEGGLMVLDCIASGSMWVDMEECGIDILISAPQKGWSSSPCCALVMMSKLARHRIESTVSTSFACDLKKWLQIMEEYEHGRYAYHATMPTDSLRRMRDMMKELDEGMGFDTARQRQQELGDRVRTLLAGYGIYSVAADGFQAPGVIVSYTSDPTIQNGSKFAENGLQVAPGVPLQCDEPSDFQTFRLGLFGIDKLNDVDAAVGRIETALKKIFGQTGTNNKYEVAEEVEICTPA